MSRSRRFGVSQRISLWLDAQGKCARCGRVLGPGWHADHRIPWCDGGLTQVANGQALCPSCNWKKGSRMPDCLQRRKWGQRALDAAIDCHEREQKLLLINAFCGSGKTLTLMDICNELFR